MFHFKPLYIGQFIFSLSLQLIPIFWSSFNGMDITADAFLGRIPGGRMSVASLVGVRIRGIGNRIQEIFQFGAN